MKNTVVITGANKGFGLELVKAFLREGYSVIAGARTFDKLMPLKEEFAESLTMEYIDLNDETSIDTFASNIKSKHKVDVIINNAATSQGVGRIYELDPSDWSYVMQVNLLGHIKLINLLVPKLIEQRKGSIINIGSMGGKKPLNLLGSYCVSKAALHHYSLCLASELRDFQIRVNTVGISANTDLYKEHAYQKAELGYTRTVERMKENSLPHPSESTDLILFLASEKSKHITGQYIECQSMNIPTW
ncbi:SDR family oxidoreductase [Bacillus atrophaeus]|uniref:SDR family oxidoreductase n=1 Tax=Bacillus atrophaeus TaxID=1452 RepID=UPI001BE9C22A|nr:SDR family oxidoreductase [Bacillus sp. ISL-32]